MRSATVSRRKLVTSLGILAIAAPVLQACSSSSAPTAPAAAPTSAGQASSSTGSPTGSQSSASSTQTSSSSKPAQSASSGGTIDLKLAVYAGANRDWMPRYAKDWATKNPNVKLTIDQIDYGQMDKKAIAEFNSGTMQDVLFSGCKWMPYDSVKGFYRAIDDYVKQSDPGLDDFVAGALGGCKWDGKLYGLPFEFNTGNNNIIYYNKDMVQAKGVKEPTDAWTTEDYTNFITKMTDSSKGIWGTDLFANNYYDLGTWARSYGSGVLSTDFKKFILNTDPNAIKAAQWMVDIRVKYKGAPSRAESQNLSVLFPSQKLASTGSCICNFTSIKQEVKDKFKWGVVLGPTGPTGGRGYDSFAAMWNMYSKSKVPEQAYNLMVAISSKESATWAVHNDDQPPARVSVWKDADLNKDNDIYSRIADWVSNGKDRGPFPVPANLRYSELNDKWANVSPALFYGEVDFKQGMQKIQDACQAIMDEPQP